MPTPGAALTTNSTWPNMMYHFDAIKGESPSFATANEAPLESYVGLPEGVKELDSPEVKSILTDLPRAGSAGQPAVIILAIRPIGLGGSGLTTSERIATLSARYPCRQDDREEYLRSHIEEELGLKIMRRGLVLSAVKRGSRT